jgi:uncharacterized cupredoxin-like copper-binding protein
MGTFTRRLTTLAAAAAAIMLWVGACSSGSTPSGTSPTATGSAAGTKVTAIEKEYSITLSQTTFTPGLYTFDVQNQGTTTHNLNIKGPGVAQQSSPDVPPGGSAQVTVTLQKGTYELWCSIDGHKDLGMNVTIQVT